MLPGKSGPLIVLGARESRAQGGSGGQESPRLRGYMGRTQRRRDHVNTTGADRSESSGRPEAVLHGAGPPSDARVSGGDMGAHESPWSQRHRRGNGARVRTGLEPPGDRAGSAAQSREVSSSSRSEEHT